MVENVFIIPIEDEAARENFSAAMDAGGYEIDALASWTRDRNLPDILRRHYPDGKCYAWGVQEGKGNNLETWKAMGPDDLVLFYLDGAIVSASFVRMKTNDPSLAAKLWSGKSEDPRGLICFTDKPYFGEVMIVPQMHSYLDPEYRDFVKLHSEKHKNILMHYGSLETFVHLCLGYDFPFSLRHS